MLVVADEIVIGASATIHADGGMLYTGAGGGRIKVIYRESMDIAETAVLSVDGIQLGTIHIEKLE